MKHFFSVLFFFFLITIFQLQFTGCANIIPPTGGLKDTLPPTIVHALPTDSAINISPKKIVLTFNEYIEVKDLTNNLLVSPLPKNNPVIDYKLKTVTIKLKDSLEENTTYTINFGNSIVDLNEGNSLRNFTYTFSTGSFIDSNQLTGKMVLAETGKVDTTLVAALYKNTNDTAVIKTKPNYLAKINGDGSFTFSNLPATNFTLYIMPNDYTKKYDDSTKMFAFADSIIAVQKFTTTKTLYAFEQDKRKPVSSGVNTNNNAQINKEKRLLYKTDLNGNKQDLLTKSLTLEFNRKVKTFDSTKILLCDTNYKKIANYSILLDTTAIRLLITTTWQENTNYYLLIKKDAVTDTTNTTYAKTDTIKFSTKKVADYGSLKIRFNNLDTTQHPVLLIMKEDVLVEAIKITQRDFSRKLFSPGEYDLKILYDTNNDGIYTTGNYYKRKQPEVVKKLQKKLSIRANWDNETEINL